MCKVELESICSWRICFVVECRNGWTCVLWLQGANGMHSVLSCAWNKPATKLIVGSVDHNLRLFGLDAQSTTS